MQDGGGRQRWAVLAAGMVTMVAACAFQYGLPFLIPALRAGGLTLSQAATLISAPIVGVLTSLVAWGALTDRVGERRVLVIGLALSAVLLGAAAPVDAILPLAVLLGLAGAAGSCVHVASGRLVLGWFGPEERGLAMGLRQMAQPLGVAMAALTLPALADRDVGWALAFLAASAVVAAALVVAVVRDRPSPPVEDDVAGSPYHGSYLWRVHASSTLLVVPQFTVAAFAFDYLTAQRAWDAAAAGSLLAAAQLGGGLIRLVVGWWSDRARSRLRPMRTLALATSLLLCGLGVAALSDATAIAVTLLWLAAVLTASTNGLAFTAVAERAGRFWAGRALGVQNTIQNLAAAATPPAVAALIVAAGPTTGHAAAFAAVAVFPVLAALVVPVAAERPL